MTIPTKEVVRVILVNPQKEMLLVKQASRGLWQFPGGLLDAGESVEKAALRELREETNISSRRAKLVHTEIISLETLHETIYCLSVKTKRDMTPKPDGKEICAIRWIPLQKINKLRLTVTTRRLLQNISIIELLV